MTTDVKTDQSKALGWYAVQRVRLADWIKPRRSTVNQSASTMANTSDSTTSNTDTHKSDTTVNTRQEQAAQHDGSSASDPTEEPVNSKDSKQMDKPSSDGKDAMKLQAVVRESHTILAKAHSVFPFQLFPDSVNIDRHKLTIVRRHFFGMEQKVSVPLENVKNVEADLGPFFGSITITSDLFINNTQDVHFLWRDDAKKIQKLVQGAVVAQGEGIDLNKIDVKKLRPLLIDLGSGHTKSM